MQLSLFTSTARAHRNRQAGANQSLQKATEKIGASRKCILAAIFDKVI